jgi:hypothetical protein
MMNSSDSNMAANAICHEAHMAGYEIQCAAAQYSRPSTIMRPKVFIDGKEWCALYGSDLQEGVAGFGKSPADAMIDFDKNWHQKLA